MVAQCLQINREFLRVIEKLFMPPVPHCTFNKSNHLYINQSHEEERHYQDRIEIMHHFKMFF